MEHYQFKADQHKDIKGYEYYGKFSEKIAQYGDENVIEFFLSLQVWGTPEQCYDKVMAIHDWTGNDAFIGVFSYAGMPPEDAEANMRLFSEKVMPRLKEFKPAGERAGMLA